MLNLQQAHKRAALRTLLAALTLPVSVGAVAQLPDPYMGRNEWNPLETEIVNLPPYCQADLRPQQYRGPGTRAYSCGGWFNHFCPGLVALNRAKNPMLSKSARRGNLDAAEDHLRYTRKHLAPECRLAGELQAAEQQAKLVRTLLSP